MNKGLRGLWDRLNGSYARTSRQNEYEAWDAAQRDRRERDGLIEVHIDERAAFHAEGKALRERQTREVGQLHATSQIFSAASATMDRSAGPLTSSAARRPIADATAAGIAASSQNDSIKASLVSQRPSDSAGVSTLGLVNRATTKPSSGHWAERLRCSGPPNQGGLP